MKKIKTAFLTLSFLALSTITYAQNNIEFKNYSFTESSPKISSEYQNSEEIVLERNLKSEFIIEEESLVEYVLFHQKKLINSNNAIEDNNKVNVPSKLSANVLVNKLRVINKNGSILELKESDIKEEVDEGKQTRYNYFAVKGLEKGAVIEQIYLIKRNAEYKGNSIRFQGNAPILKTTLELIYPKNLLFSSASYNGLPKAISTLDAYEGKNSLKLTEENIDPLPVNERQSNVEKNAKRIAYKLNENFSSGVKNLFNHNDYAKELFDQYHASLSKNDLKELDVFIKQIKLQGDEFSNIRNTEAAIKEKITFNRYFNKNSSIADVLKNKQGNYFDLIKLYVQTYKKLNIENEIVFTTERFEDVFDPNFESYLNFKDLLFYFPKSDVYVEPAATLYRTPMFDPQFGGNTAVFIKANKYLDMLVPVLENRAVEFPKNQDLSKMDIQVDFSKDVQNPTLKSKVTFNGFESLNFQPNKDFMDPVEYKEMMNFVAKNYSIESEIDKIDYENEGLVNVGLKPFVLNIETNGKDLVTKAGTNYLFNIGKTIGKQMEMYDEKERVFPIELENPHSYDRTITLVLPKGYEIKNLDVFKTNYSLKYQGKVVADFVSNYELKDNVLIIKNTESYNFVEIPASTYIEYQKIINAAADFNKLSVVIEKI